MKNLKKLTILHSNDMHGDFLAEQIDEKLVGGVSFLSGYVNMVRRQEKNVLYAIAGDMFRGSVIDSEYKGVSTIGIMNLLGPDVATIGNHEVDYGLSHLLFLEKCANFPIINANFHIRANRRRLFQPFYIAEMDGMKILFIGIITEDILAQTKADELIGSFVDIGEAALEVGNICNAYNGIDIDFTVLLTHIGFEDYQFSHGMQITWSRGQQEFETLTLDGKALDKQKLYTIALSKFHYMNMQNFLDISLEELKPNAPPRVLATSYRDIIEEYMMMNPHLFREVEGRLVVKE